MTLRRTAVETAISGVHALLGTGGVPTSLTMLFWRWPTASSVFAGRSVQTSFMSFASPHFLLSLISLMVSVDVKHHVYLIPHLNTTTPSLSLISLMVSVDVKHHAYLLDGWMG